MSERRVPLSDRIGRELPAAAITLIAAVAAAATACGKSPQTPIRPQPIAYADTLPIEPPAEVEPSEIERLLETAVGGEIGYAFSLRRWLGAQHEALNITRFDDVVNSAWFEHRNARYPMTTDDVARGPTTGGPDTTGTLTVIGGKTAGISPGFTVRDAKGDTYLFKFDPKGNLHLASAAGVISSRLFWAAGYYTPEDYIVVFDSAHLVLDPEAEIDTQFEERPMVQEDIQSVLSLTDQLPDGRFLALASKFVPGRPLGPFLFSGVREDDPNDYYYHEYRRELRGLYVMSSWLNHVDMRFANTMDVFIDPPGYIRHYLIDFAATLGSGTIRSHNPREGTEYNFDFWPTMARVFTGGFYKLGWEDERHSDIHAAIGWIAVESFEPHKWKPNWPNPAFTKKTVRDAYWGAKLVASFSDEQIAAAVSQGNLPAEAADLLTKALIARRDKVVAYWYDEVAPIEDVRVETHAQRTIDLSFDDLGLEAGVREPSDTRYTWRFEDPTTSTETSGELPARPFTRQSLQLELSQVPAAGRVRADQDFATLRIAVVRSERSQREAVVYMRWRGEEVGYEVVGLEH
jgi:hypothetical protein